MMYSVRSDEVEVPYHEPFGLGPLDPCHEPVKWLSRKACLKCHKRDDVLVCSNAGCPIVVHEGCMSCSACFDSSGNFCCAYCLYKRSLADCHKAKEQALIAKAALASFLNGKALKSKGDIIGGLNEDFVKKNASAFRDTCFHGRQGTINSKDVEVGVDFCERADDQEPVKSSKCGSLHENLEESGILSPQEESAKTESEFIGEKYKSNDSVYEADIHVRAHPTVNLEFACKPTENVDHHIKTDHNDTGSRKIRHASFATTKGYDESHSQGIYVVNQNHESRDLDGLVKGLVWADHHELTKRGAIINEDGKGQSYCVSENEHSGRRQMEESEMDADQDSDIGNNCIKVDEEQKVFLSQANDSTSLREQAGRPDEEFHDGDRSQSSQESHFLGPQARTIRKRKISMYSKIGKPKKSFGSSESGLEEVTSSKSRQRSDSAKVIQRHITPVARRKKLPWAVEEEEVLKEGVQNFSLTANINLPWKKILEFGRHIFDGTRTPTDLRDKWKNMVRKAHSKSTMK